MCPPQASSSRCWSSAVAELDEQAVQNWQAVSQGFELEVQRSTYFMAFAEPSVWPDAHVSAGEESWGS